MDEVKYNYEKENFNRHLRRRTVGRDRFDPAGLDFPSTNIFLYRQSSCFRCDRIYHRLFEKNERAEEMILERIGFGYGNAFALGHAFAVKQKSFNKVVAIAFQRLFAYVQFFALLFFRQGKGFCFQIKKGEYFALVVMI